ncbi:MAG: cytochrome o ubiquinol oxidase subunit IV [Francisellaceae bacterium]
MMSKEHLYDEQTGMSYGTYGSYVVGFILSIVLTLIAFWLVGFHVLPKTGAYIAIAVLALLQLFVQLYFFLHLDFGSKTRWNLTAFIFALVVVIILVFGSLWIMYNLNEMMMPM